MQKSCLSLKVRNCVFILSGWESGSCLDHAPSGKRPWARGFVYHHVQYCKTSLETLSARWITCSSSHPSEISDPMSWRVIINLILSLEDQLYNALLSLSVNETPWIRNINIKLIAHWSLPVTQLCIALDHWLMGLLNIH